MYSDGSEAEFGVGCTFCVFESLDITRIWSSRLSNKNTVFQAEIIALRELIKFSKNFNTDQVIKIHVNNTAVIQAVFNLKKTNKIAREISTILLDNSNIEIISIKAHNGYKGKEGTDTLAKQATENGIPYTYIQIPRCFFKGLLEYLLLDKWQNEWTEDVTGRDIYNLIPKIKCAWNHGEERK
ncbi:hypothetical protein AVEN_44791-1 [Araneus ventricosus]|uniref:RNase H type-1 domain-containing protein n=1 Tax=Araneus ventricosus TaxID=182803 RepID=A0A4Y2QN77_ARAVE|nr:hypothetical protein AVEN_44791-1 [Araneus ventricosus]